MIEREHVEWFKNLYATLTDGGRWGVPRSGLTYVKRGPAMVLVARAPHGTYPDAVWAEYQDTEIEAIRVHFEAAGVPYRNELTKEN